MAGYQTWTSSLPVRHPWFDAPTTKRKRPDNTVDETETDFRSSKRPRCSVLERGFAGLSLDNRTVTNDVVAEYPMEEITMPLNIPPPNPSAEVQPSEIVRPSSIEEPYIPDIKMQTSWYEPEPDRIIVTDLDSFTEEDEGEHSLRRGGEGDGGPSLPICINPTLLDRIWRDGLNCLPQPTTRALVLYQPVLQREESQEERREEDSSMDVEG